ENLAELNAQVKAVCKLYEKEDASQCCRGYSAENLAVIRHIGLNLLSRDKKSKVGVKAKRLKAGWNNNYLKTILEALDIVIA
ncbi:MAG: hypothetical protein WCQ26_05305, partial [Pseudanabaena sp. ELA748]